MPQGASSSLSCHSCLISLFLPSGEGTPAAAASNLSIWGPSSPFSIGCICYEFSRESEHLTAESNGTKLPWPASLPVGMPFLLFCMTPSHSHCLKVQLLHHFLREVQLRWILSMNNCTSFFSSSSSVLCIVFYKFEKFQRQKLGLIYFCILQGILA